MDSSSSVGDYEVFLSFRGADTRQGFTDVLYDYMSRAEIRVFRDDDELAVGDKIDSIFGAINNSKICIPIFSPKFAESKWCLNEVAKMVELKKTIVPVFYKVKSDDVKLKTSLYSNDLQKLEEKYGEHQVQKWKDALKEVVSNKGRTLSEKQGYTEFCKELVDEVLSKLGPRKILDIDYFVGDANKARTMELLDMMGPSSSHQVIYVGIHGMGGIGKTTLTKLIHNECMSSFDHCAFLPDIREFSKCNGVKGLPKYLYDNVEPKSFTAFNQSHQIPNTFKNKKVLLILDDVDNCEQIKAIASEPGWFGPGSRIIVTTRDRDVLRDYEEEGEIKLRYLEMEELDSGWSLELFNKCAFIKDSPPPSYQDLSKRVVAYAGGLPLTITVIGKLLRRYRTEEKWEEFIERLDKNPPKEVKDRLLISYQELEENEKKIFLDIACLFIREEFTETSNLFYMWKACNLYPRLSLEVLQARSLVKIDRFSRLQMHDQLRDIGRDIVRAKSRGDVTKQSRLWESSEVMEVLKCKKKSKENIEAIQVPADDINVEEFISFYNLRCLTFGRDFTLQGDFSNLLPKLVWLRCHRSIIEPLTLVPSNLVILDLFGSDLDGDGDICSQIQVLKKLKVLDLSHCLRLERTPVFGENMVLERLNLSWCDNLNYIDPSIAKLQHLSYLSFDECYSLDELPESLGELHALRELNLRLTSITCLPDSIGRLDKLEGLDLYSCESLVNLPQSLGNLRSLVYLNIEHTKINGLPAFIGRLEKLQELDLRYNEGDEVVTNGLMLWHPLHIHQLVLTQRRRYICDYCNQEGKLWSYCCKECDFDLHSKCASLKNVNSTEQSSILEEGDLQYLENPTRDVEGNNQDMQDDASCSGHLNLEAQQSFISSGSQHGRSYLAWHYKNAGYHQRMDFQQTLSVENFQISNRFPFVRLPTKFPTASNRCSQQVQFRWKSVGIYFQRILQ